MANILKNSKLYEFFKPKDSFYISEPVTINTTNTIFTFTNPTSKHCVFNLILREAETSSKYLTNLLIYGTFKNGSKSLLYDLDNIIISNPATRNQLNLSLPLNAMFYGFEIHASANGSAINAVINISEVPDFFNTKTNEIAQYQNLLIGSSSSSSITIDVPLFAKFLNLGIKTTGAYSTDFSIQNVIVASSTYKTIESKLATTDTYAFFEFVTIPVWKSYIALGQYTDRELRILITNNDGSNSITLVGVQYQFIF